MAVDSFRRCVGVEQKWAPTLDAYLRSWVDANSLDQGCGPHPIRAARLTEQWRGYDRVVEGCGVCGAGPVFVEYKADERAVRTGNLFIETVSNDRTGRAGWALTSRSRWLLYLAAPSRVYVFATESLRAALPDWRRRFQLRPALNAGYRTLGLVVPAAVAAGVAELVEDLAPPHLLDP